MRVYIREHATDHFITTVEVEPANSVYFLKNKVSQQKQLPLCELSLYHEESELEDDEILAA